MVRYGGAGQRRPAPAPAAEATAEPTATARRREDALPGVRTVAVRAGDPGFACGNGVTDAGCDGGASESCRDGAGATESDCDTTGGAADGRCRSGTTFACRDGGAADCRRDTGETDPRPDSAAAGSCLTAGATGPG